MGKARILKGLLKTRGAMTTLIPEWTAGIIFFVLMARVKTAKRAAGFVMIALKNDYEVYAQGFDIY